jgi:hypothetical protein
MRMLKRMATVAVAAALGAGAAFGATACGEDREGDVQFEGGTGTETTGTEGGTGTETTGTEGTPTSPGGPTGTGTTPGAAGTNTETSP